MSLFLLAIVSTAGAEIIYVDADASTGGDGQTWGTAYKYLQDALYKPPSGGDQIWVTAGSYKPDQDGGQTPGDRTTTFQLINGVAIYGGFAGGETSLDERDWQTNETILSGDINTPGDNSDNSYHVVTGSGTNATAILNGFTITAGNADHPQEPARNGGGMYNNSGSPTVSKCRFSRNSAKYGGGMLNLLGSSPTVTNCTFSGNSATNQGGGMYNYLSSSPTVMNCTFSGNEAQYGGGMYNGQYSDPKVTNCAFSENLANYQWGGGMLNTNYSDPNVTNCTFTGNKAISKGGGMYNFINCAPTVTNCIFWGDTAPDGNEIALVNSSTINVNYCDIRGSQTDVYVQSGCTLNWGEGNIDADPLFVDTNGPDGIAGTEDDNLRLLPGSTCIDAADSTALLGLPVITDLDGKDRYVDIDSIDDTGSGPLKFLDMGSYEFRCSGLAGDSNCDGVVDFKDLAILAGNWLAGTEPEL